ATNTLVARSMLARSANDPTANVESWRAILNRDDVGKKVLAYDVPFVDQNEVVSDVTVTLSTSAATPDTPRAAGTGAPPAGVVSVVTAQADFSRVPGPSFRADRASAALNAPTLLNFESASQSDPETTVMVLHRPLPAENHFIVLLRPESRATGTE